MFQQLSRENGLVLVDPIMMGSLKVNKHPLRTLAYLMVSPAILNPLLVGLVGPRGSKDRMD